MISKKIKVTPKVLVITVGTLLLLAGVVYGVWHFVYSQTDTYKTEQAAQETKKVVDQVSKLMLLPTEEPVIFDIKDPETLVREQQFFAGSQKGDKLLVFQAASKAIIYSPDRNIIVNVGPVTYDGTNPTTPQVSPSN